MTDRRRWPRFLFVAPFNGCARTVSDCIVERWDGQQAVIVTTTAALPGEDFVLMFEAPSGDRTSCGAHVVSCTPVAGSGPAQYRLHLALADASAAPRHDLVPDS